MLRFIILWIFAVLALFTSRKVFRRLERYTVVTEADPLYILEIIPAAIISIFVFILVMGLGIEVAGRLK